MGWGESTGPTCFAQKQNLAIASTSSLRVSPNPSNKRPRRNGWLMRLAEFSVTKIKSCEISLNCLSSLAILSVVIGTWYELQLSLHYSHVLPFNRWQRFWLLLWRTKYRDHCITNSVLFCQQLQRTIYNNFGEHWVFSLKMYQFVKENLGSRR